MLEYHSLSDLIYTELKKRIVFSQYAPEAKLEIDQIAKEFGVSRTPVINALRTLEKDGYVVIVPRSGTHVRRYSAEEIEALFDFREALECVVVRKSIHSADPAELKKFMAALEETLQKTQREQGSFDVDGYYDLQSEFHAYLWNLCPAIIRNELRNIVDLTKRVCKRHLLFSSQQANANTFYEHEINIHIRLANAILEQDEPAASRFIRQDICQTKEAVLAHYEEVEPPFN